MRIDLDTWMLNLAAVVSMRGTCSKRKVGAVVFDIDNQVVATGYNGPVSGQPHCIDKPCKAIDMEAPVSHLACRAVHAEANALLRAGAKAKGGILALTTTPCYECAKLIVNAGVSVIIAAEVNRLFYDTNPLLSQSPADLLNEAGIIFRSPYDQSSPNTSS